MAEKPEKIKFPDKLKLIKHTDITNDSHNDNKTKNQIDNESDEITIDIGKPNNTIKENESDKDEITIDIVKPNISKSQLRHRSGKILKKVDGIPKMKLNNEGQPWNYKIVLLLQKIGKKSMGYRWMHDQESQLNETKNLRFLIVEVVLLSIMGCLTGSQMIGLLASSGLSDDKTTQIVVSAITILFVLILAIIKGIRETSKFNDNAQRHTEAARKFSEISLDIQNQLSLNIDDRDTDKDFLNSIISKFNDTMSSAPKISQDVQNRLVEASEEHDVYNPLVIGDYGNIQIVMDKENIEDANQEEKDTEDDSYKKKSQYQVDRWLRHF
ncbi:hypothetical protein QKU48_gp0671 [Fadolivirus algeromassiliense]|jgi:hypothetical protein|uniref:SMODS and SLOG-associating 2TM effector domain-containing protein n=1 Tax=Fadolivirus FV1/VV64 TaxID=3070911 RepID=A0A7D3UVE7_9VIRU|nr:hypothetical protein QKU48_gp0671 [Fadolivirus algeromassiliense]QKF94129.1 hypothetical protein Fadolivirus_1_671 [Fadolivirus FV1/VV64]